MNNIIERRIEQFIVTKFLKEASELSLVTFIVKAIESDLKQKTQDHKLVEKQIESKQIHVLNLIRDSFSNGDTFLKYFNFKTNNISFANLNGIKIMNFVNELNNLKSTDIVAALNQSNVKKTFIGKVKHKKNNHSNNITIVHKKRSKDIK